MAVKLTDIALQVGMSEATVSLALNNRRGIKPETRKLVQDTANRLGYTPNIIAKTLARQKSNNIGIIVTDIGNAYFGEFAMQCEKHIRKRGYSSLFAFSVDQRNWEEVLIEQFIAQRVAGVIIVPPAINDNARISYLNRLENYGIKYIFATSHYSMVDAPFVMTDLEKGTYQSVKYLLDLGHKNILFLGADPQMIPTLKRLDGYRRAFLENGMEFNEHLLIRCENADFECGKNAVIQALVSGIKFDAIVTINDMLALGSLRALQTQKIDVPGDISLIGFDDIIYSEVATIPLSTVHQDVKAIAYKAVDILFHMIDNNIQTNEKILIEPQLIIRESTSVYSNRTQ